MTFPRGGVSTETDSRWMIVNVKEWQKLVEGSDPHVTGGGGGGGSAELSKMMAQRWEFIRSVFSGSSSGLSSGSRLKEETKG